MTDKHEQTKTFMMLQKRVTNLREHRDFEKEFEIKTTFIEEIPQTDKHFVSPWNAKQLCISLLPPLAC